MGTPAVMIFTDGEQELWFYRHYDGNPQHVVEHNLVPMMKNLVDGTWRNDLTQLAGWIVVLGHQEYKDDPLEDPSPFFSEWNCGAWHPHPVTRLSEIPSWSWVYQINMHMNEVVIGHGVGHYYPKGEEPDGVPPDAAFNYNYEDIRPGMDWSLQGMWKNSESFYD